MSWLIQVGTPAPEIIDYSAYRIAFHRPVGSSST